MLSFPVPLPATQNINKFPAISSTPRWRIPPHEDINIRLAATAKFSLGYIERLLIHFAILPAKGGL